MIQKIDVLTGILILLGLNLLVLAKMYQVNRHLITVRRRLESDLQVAQLQLQQNTLEHRTELEALKTRYDERKYLEQMKDEFISIVSHELRTPLTSVHGALKILASGLVGSSSEQGQQLLKIAANSADRLVRLINDILDVEKIDVSPQPMNLSRCPVMPLLQEVRQLLSPYASEMQVDLKLEAMASSEAMVAVLADHDRLVQVLMNLLNNAIQFSPTNGIVWLRAECSGTQVQFAVQDQGHGIPAEKLAHVFDRFQQVDASSARPHEGSGLGLAICRNIVQQHQGRIWLESVVGQGTTFYFTIPIAMAIPNQRVNISGDYIQGVMGNE